MTPDFLILYVDNPAASARFYHELLSVAPVQASPTFVLFALASSLNLGLWSRHTVEPAAQAAGGGGEIAFQVTDAAELDTAHAQWQARGVTIAQPPCDMDFGRSFTMLDPDGHRLRIFQTR